MTSLIQSTGSVAAATAQFQANRASPNGDLNQAFVDTILARRPTSRRTPPIRCSTSRSPSRSTTRPARSTASKSPLSTSSAIAASVSRAPIRWCAATSASTSPPTLDEDQFALLGLSDTANATFIYDKNGLSARLTYNWRDKFLQATNRGGSRNPVFVAPFGQLDFNISYDVTPKLAVSLEGINLTKETCAPTLATRTSCGTPRNWTGASCSERAIASRGAKAMVGSSTRPRSGKGRCSQRPFLLYSTRTSKLGAGSGAGRRT
jgi:hypothetical protein